MLSWVLRWFYIHLSLLLFANREFKSSYDKTVFCFRTTKEFPMPLFLLFSHNIHLDSIFGGILKEASYKKCSGDVLSNFIFKRSYFLNENILRKSKKKGHAYITLLGSGVFILVEKPTGKAWIGKKDELVSKFKSFF